MVAFISTASTLVIVALAAACLIAPTAASRLLLASIGTNVCQPGYAQSPADPADVCAPCGKGAFCFDGARTPCSNGLTTLTATARQAADCVPPPGYGYDGTTAAPCAVGSYSRGGTFTPCRPCGAGLTTAAPGAASSTACVAPAGSFLRRGVPRLCPNGTFSAAPGTATACTPCPTGVTTPGSGATSASACALAKPGFRLTTPPADGTAAAAQPCAPDTFSASEHASSSCSPCPGGTVTKAAGAAQASACTPPPGFSLSPLDNTATPCPVGSYKPGFARTACISCGAGLRTATAGSDSFSDCFVPAGYGVGTSASGVLEAAACVSGFYGLPEDTYGVADAPCSACPAGMTSSSVAGSNRGVEACVTLPGYAYDVMTGDVVQCPRGSWAAGGAVSEACTPCDAGLTTRTRGATAPGACVARSALKALTVQADGAPPSVDASVSVEGEALKRA